MGRYEILDTDHGTPGGQAQADILCEMGVRQAAGRGCPVDLVEAHKWLNIAAIKGSPRAAELRADLAVSMTKADLAKALRAAREWMSMN